MASNLSVLRLIGDIDLFNINCVVGIEPNYVNLKRNLDNSIMLVTSIKYKIGYESKNNCKT